MIGGINFRVIISTHVILIFELIIPKPNYEFKIEFKRNWFGLHMYYYK